MLKCQGHAIAPYFINCLIERGHKLKAQSSCSSVVLPYSIGWCLVRCCMALYFSTLPCVVVVSAAVHCDGLCIAWLCIALLWCLALYFIVMWCVLMWAAVRLDTMLCSSTQYFTVMICIVSSCNVRLYVLLRRAVLYFAALYWAVLMELNCNVSSCSCAMRCCAVVCWAWLGCNVKRRLGASWLVAASGGYGSVVGR